MLKKKKKAQTQWAWWHSSVIPVLGRLRQEDHELKVHLGYIARPCLQKKAKTKADPRVSRLLLITSRALLGKQLLVVSIN
jgi:hypothetical protein